VAENRPGFGGNIGAELVARAPPDGYTLLMTTAAHAINVSLYAKFGYDPVRDFAPVTLVSAAPNMQSYEANVWFGLFAPAGTPPAVINRHLRVPIRDSRTIDEETRRSLQ
jgi:tripartite-type tricarboxylate transporter receptor subunit TctC